MKSVFHKKERLTDMKQNNLLLLVFFATIPILLLGILLFLPSCERDKDEATPLKITSLSPDAAYYGDTIAIIGEGFSPDIADGNTVVFSGNATATLITDGSGSEKLRVIVPTGATEGPITVTVVSTKETAQSPDFYLSTPEVQKYVPDSAWIGDTLQIYGTGFRKQLINNIVTLGSVTLTNIKIQGDTLLYVSLPFGATTDSISVLGAKGPEFTVRTPEILTLTPGKAGATDTLTITGNGLYTYSTRPGGLYLGTVNTVLNVLVDNSTGCLIKAVVPVGSTDGNILYYDGTTTVTGPALNIIPKIASVSPTSAPVGTGVTITGYNFGTSASKNAVLFNGQAATVTSVAESNDLYTLITSVPSGASDGPVTLIANNDTTTGPDFTITSDGTPLIYSISPTSAAPGGTILITGKYFSATTSENTVMFTGSVQGTVLTATTTQLTVRVPSGTQKGTFTVTVDGKTGTGPTLTITDRTQPVISAVHPVANPTSDYITAGMEVTITGANFPEEGDVENIDVIIGTTNATVTACTPTTITCTIPSTIATGERSLQVTTYNLVSNSYTMTISGVPTIVSISPDNTSAGSTVALTATNYHNITTGNTVYFGTTQATVSAVNTNTGVLTVVVPEIDPGTCSVTLRAFGNTSNAVSFTINTTTVAKKAVYYWKYASDVKSLVKIATDATATTTYTSSTTQASNVIVLDKTNNKIYYDDLISSKRDILGKSLSDDETVSPDTLVHTKMATIYDFTLNSGTVIWSYVNKIYIGSSTVYWTGTTSTYNYGLVYTNGYLYWCVYSGTSGNVAINRATVSSSGLSDVTTLYTTSNGLSLPYEMKIDVSAGKMFIVNKTSDGYYQILSGNLDGSSGSLTQVLGYTSSGSSDQIHGIGLDVENQYIYWLKSASGESSDAAIYRCDYAGTSSTVEAIYTSLGTKISYYSGLDVDAGVSSQSTGMHVTTKFNNLPWLK
jgi:hypothetical protein